MLKKISDFISMNFRNIDILGRVQEDEFICFVNHLMSKELASLRKEEMLRLFRQKKLSDISENIELEIGFYETNHESTYENMYQEAKKQIKET